MNVDGDSIVVNGDRIKVFAERDPAKLPWGSLGVDIVFECTGIFTSKAKAGAHLAGGAKKVLISAPGGKDVDATVVYGVNHDTLDLAMTVVSNASCTTNCLAPLAKVLNDNIGIESRPDDHDPRLHQRPGADRRLSTRTCAARARPRMSMIPTKTGAAAAVGLVLPELKGKLDGFAIRVPTINVSLVDLTFKPKRATTVEEINTLVKAAADGAAEGRAGLHRRAAGLDRLQPRSGFLHLRRHADQDHRRQPGQGLLLVRQRVGLLQPHARHRAGLVQSRSRMKVLRMAELELAGKRVLIREDLNVPVKDGEVTSDARIRAALPTIKLALAKGARVILLSHLGRPEEGEYDPELSLAPGGRSSCRNCWARRCRW